jgi:uncharacterized UBP type Zn finger protein
VARCEHLEELPVEEVKPNSTEGCSDCLENGQTQWTHLRMCLSCGHVACCDSTPNQHATGHFMNTSHPVMRSFEPGEEWRWCYVDRKVV